MSGRIPQSFIDELIARADVVEVIGERIALKKAGREYKAVCPFHDEKTPSFTVSPQKGFYHCFGCGAHGTSIGFLMNYENLSFIDAVEALAEMLGLEVPSDGPEHNTSRENTLYDILAEADQIYRAALRDSPAAIEYLKQRGIDGTTANRFTMGYAPDSWDTLLKALGGDDAQVKNLLEAGLIIKNEQGRQYDRFRDRIMFPIRDPRGRIIGFGGRALGDGEPKYLNSPETPVFHKGQALYGLHEARHIGSKEGYPNIALVVEGYLDVASLSQYGIVPALATLGTATTTDHIRRLTRIADCIIFCFDGDRAGRAAAWKALETALPHAGDQIEIKFLILPEGEDPDSLVRARGANAFRELMDRAEPLSDFLLGELENRADLSSADGRSRLATLTQPLLAQLPIGVHRELLINQLAERIGLKAERLETLIKVPETPSPRATRRPRAGDTGDASGAVSERRSILIRKAITLILHHPAAGIGLLEGVPGLIGVRQPGALLLRQLLEAINKNPKITMAGLLERFRDDPEGRHLGRLASDTPLDGGEVVPQVLRDNLKRIVNGYRKGRMGALLTRGQEDLDPQEQKELEGLLRKFPDNLGEP